MAKQENSVEEEGTLQGQANIWKIMFSFVESMALKCAIELHIADIINAHGHPITLSEIATSIGSPSPDISCLARIMRLLVHKRIFTLSQPTDDGNEAVYGLTNSSRWRLRDTSELSLATMVVAEYQPGLMAPWNCLSKCVQEGGEAFTKAHGCNLWDLATAKPKFNNLFNEAMACTAKIVVKASCQHIEKGLPPWDLCQWWWMLEEGLGTAVTEIVKTHPHLHRINFDLQHVVVTAPQYPGVSHV